MKLKQCQPAVTDHRGGLKTLKDGYGLNPDRP